MIRILRVVLKLVLLPLHLILKAAWLIGTVVTALSSWIFYLVGTIFLLTTIGSFGFGIASGPELKSMLITSLCVLFAPMAAELILVVVGFFADCLKTI